MTELRATHVFSGLAVHDFQAAKGWYEQLFGRPPDMLPHETEAAWSVTDGGLVYVVSDQERAGGGLVTLIVENLDLSLAEVAGRGLSPGPVEVMGSGARKATLVDPAGNRVALAQP